MSQTVSLQDKMSQTDSLQDLNEVIRIKMFEKVKNLVPYQNIITKSSIRSAFLLPDDAFISLLYMVDGVEIVCGTHKSEPCFLLPNDWRNIEFLLESNKAPSHPVSPLKIQAQENVPTSVPIERPLTPMEVEKAERIQHVINEWEDRVFLIKGEKLQGSGVLISDQHILTAAHLSFKLQRFYNIRGTNGRSFTVKCEFICNKFDFAILKSNDLPQMEISTGHLDRGNRFFLIGYPSGIEESKPTITKGIIEGIMKDKLHLVGTPGSTRGYSGGPVLNYSGNLAGILLGATSGLTVDTTIQECLDSSAEQKYARILITTIIIYRYSLGQSDNES